MSWRILDGFYGRTFTKVTGCEVGSDEVTFHRDDGAVIKMYHEQDCCETVDIVDVCGDPNDLVGAVLVEAEESWSRDVEHPEVAHMKTINPLEDHAWTFYRFQTHKGQVSIRWLGESNGYYSMSVNCEFTVTPGGSDTIYSMDEYEPLPYEEHDPDS